jgi:hypothetical protein
MTEPSIGSLKIPVVTFLPRQLTSRGKPIWTEMSSTVVHLSWLVFTSPTNGTLSFDLFVEELIDVSGDQVTVLFKCEVAGVEQVELQVR